MYKNKRVAALIAAGGSGRRMGGSKPKQFLSAGGGTLLEKSTEAFDTNASVDDIYIVVPREFVGEAENMEYTKIKGIVIGGPTRQQSVLNGLRGILKESGKNAGKDIDIVLIHDAARPYVSDRIIDDVLQSVLLNGAAVPVVPVKDTIKSVTGDHITGTPDRQSLYAAQTPQGFDYSLIRKAHEEAADAGYSATDDAQLVERMGRRVFIVAGEDSNIKITTPEDMPDGDVSVGLGFDVHAFAEDRDLVLGGIKIPYEKGLLGHSDADVLTHALMDAILGALNMGDIGTNFPDTDQEYKDIRSTILLEKVSGFMAQRGYTLGNADLIIVAEKPKMKDHIKTMRENLAGILGVNPDRISIKATTTEGLGFTGREEGMGAQAIVRLVRKEKITK